MEEDDRRSTSDITHKRSLLASRFSLLIPLIKTKPIKITEKPTIQHGPPKGVSLFCIQMIRELEGCARLSGCLDEARSGVTDVSEGVPPIVGILVDTTWRPSRIPANWVSSCRHGIPYVGTYVWYHLSFRFDPWQSPWSCSAAHHESRMYYALLIFDIVTLPPFLTTDVHFYIHAVQIHRDEHHKGKSPIPDTKGTEEGSSKRNIARKHDHDPNRYVCTIRSGRCSDIISDQSIYCRHVNIVLMFHCVVFHKNLCLITL